MADTSSVRLVSAEDFVFVVSREAACVSPTIVRMLEGACGEDNGARSHSDAHAQATSGKPIVARFPFPTCVSAKWVGGEEAVRLLPRACGGGTSLRVPRRWASTARCCCVCLDFAAGQISTPVLEKVCQYLYLRLNGDAAAVHAFQARAHKSCNEPRAQPADTLSSCSNAFLRRCFSSY